MGEAQFQHMLEAEIQCEPAQQQLQEKLMK